MSSPQVSGRADELVLRRLFYAVRFRRRLEHSVADQAGDDAIVQIAQAKEWCVALQAALEHS